MQCVSFGYNFTTSENTLANSMQNKPTGLTSGRASLSESVVTWYMAGGQLRVVQMVGNGLMKVTRQDILTM